MKKHRHFYFFQINDYFKTETYRKKINYCFK